MAKYSIVLPVRNGGMYVKECVNSILAQTLNDFELQVLDNCSTDGTREWIISLNDPRISIYPASHSLTIEENWGRIVKIPKNEFITLIGHDDTLDANFLQVMDDLISKYPDAGLYTAHFRFTDAKGQTIRSCKAMTEKQTAAEFLSSFLQGTIDIMGTGFMMRAADYDRLGGIPPYPNLLFADFDLYISLAKISYKATARDSCFTFRIHQSTTSISADIKLHAAFKEFVHFLQQLQRENDAFKEVISREGSHFLAAYSTSFAHRLLRTPSAKRPGTSVQGIIDEFVGYAKELNIAADYKPVTIRNLQLAKKIDETPVLRNLFLLFKKIWKRPVIR